VYASSKITNRVNGYVSKKRRMSDIEDTSFFQARLGKSSATPGIYSEEKQKPGVGAYDVRREFDPEGFSGFDLKQKAMLVKEWKK